jgi:hypothetical protein
MRARLGDDIDDFCVKCKRIMNHAVVSLVGEEPAKVRCRTCHSDHDYRHETPPPPKVDPRKAALFNQVLEKVTGDVPGVSMDHVPVNGVAVDGVAVDGVAVDGVAVDSVAVDAAASDALTDSLASGLSLPEAAGLPVAAGKPKGRVKKA